MQATAAQAPAPPATTAPVTAPLPAPAPLPTTVLVRTADGTQLTLPVPVTRQDVENLRARREELSNQLTSAAGRRKRLAEELAQQPPGAEAVRAGLEGRLFPVTLLSAETSDRARSFPVKCSCSHDPP